MTDARFRNIRRRHPCASRRFPTEASTKLIERFAPLAERLSIALDREVEFTPVTDCAATVEALVTGRVDLAWLGGFTSVQARLRSNGAVEPTGLSQMLQSESSAGF